MSTNIGFKLLPCRKQFQTEFNKRALKRIYALIWWSISVSLRSFRQNGVFLSHISGSISNLNYSTNETKLLTGKTKKKMLKIIEKRPNARNHAMLIVALTLRRVMSKSTSTLRVAKTFPGWQKESLRNMYFVRLVTNVRQKKLSSLNSLTPMSDQDRISPYNINTISTR